jgi:hypothetical protein
MPKPLIAAARRLAEVLERENAALAVMDLPRAASFLPEKTTAFADLAKIGEAGPAPPHPDLIAAARSLDAAALENRRLLKRALAAQERAIGIMARAVSAVMTRPAYGNRGRMTPMAGPMTLSTNA